MRLRKSRSVGRPKRKYEFYVDEEGCFICTSHARGKWGHAMTGHKGKVMGVYRHIYIECFGDIPEGGVVRHKCDKGECINPEHLELGSDQDNKNDMVRRGRSVKGENHHFAKITEEIAYFIKNDTAHTAKELSEEYGISVRQIMKIRSGQRWGHVEYEKPVEELKRLRDFRRAKNFKKHTGNL